MKKILIGLVILLALPLMVFADSSKTIYTEIVGSLEYSGDTYAVNGEWRNIDDPSITIPFRMGTNTVMYVQPKNGYDLQLDTVNEYYYGMTYTYQLTNCSNLLSVLQNKQGIVMTVGLVDPYEPQTYCNLM